MLHLQEAPLFKSVAYVVNGVPLLSCHLLNNVSPVNIKAKKFGS